MPLTSAPISTTARQPAVSTHAYTPTTPAAPCGNSVTTVCTSTQKHRLPRLDNILDAGPQRRRGQVRQGKCGNVAADSYNETGKHR